MLEVGSRWRNRHSITDKEKLDSLTGLGSGSCYVFQHIQI